ncbi:MAG: dUTP diphosphatase [Gammaproteobacteria bacterium]
MHHKIINMLELQDAMNSKVNPHWRSAANEWYRAIWMESSEMLEHYGWKWWKKQLPDVMQVKLEVVDIVHFALSIRLEQGATLDTIATDIAMDFSKPRATDDVRTTIELLARETLFDKGAHFSIIAGVMAHLEMPFDELYQIYVGKNVLNMFRQENGYKQGTYQKTWAGREDNEHLADILESLDCDNPAYRDEIYAALSGKYESNNINRVPVGLVE